MTGSDDDGTATDLLVECIRDPARGPRRLPAIVGLLEAEDELTRLVAAWTCCVVAVSHPETVEYVVRRLSDRLGAEEVSLELTHALDYLADRYPEQVEAAVATAEADAGATTDGPDVPLPRMGRFTRAHYYGQGAGPGDSGRGGVGRVRYPDSDEDDPRQTYTTGEPDEREMDEHRAGNQPDEALDDTAGEDTTGEAAHPSGSGSESAAGSGDAGAIGDLVGERTDVEAIADRSRFDQLHVLATRERGRYADEYRALVGEGNEQQAVSLLVLHQPTEQRARPAFEDGIRESLERWQSISDHDHVVSLYDWGLEPRPWLATAYPGDTLVEQDPDATQALADAIDLADAVSHLHRNDVVHGAIDAKNVAYPGDALEEDEAVGPLLHNVGLLSVFRFHVDPATVLDPRFAAPEYFDRQFGTVDAATDIYQLGAVVFALFAGRPPYGGSIQQVRAAVTDDDGPVPGDIAEGVPSGVDEAVAKAMATRKLTRYETVEHFHQDLLAVRRDPT